MTAPKYNRVILKISGEALAGDKRFGINTDTLSSVCDQIVETFNLGTEIAIVVGGGNFWRGRSGKGMDRSTADHMGMLATVINALALQDSLEAKGVPTRVQTAIDMRQIAEPYIRRKAVRHLEKRRIVIFACGTGNPYFSTDTTAALRAAEIGAEVILLAKKVDGVYDSDPETNPDAKKFDTLSHLDILNKGLGVIDSTAASLCMDNKIPIVVFGLNEPENIVKVVMGENIGTSINTNAQ
jgi:uridylate kinase